MDCKNFGGKYIETCSAVGDSIILVEEGTEEIDQDQTLRIRVKSEDSSVVCKDEDIELWVQEKPNKDCIKLFKPHFSISPKYPELGLDGYVLLLMTKPQIEFMKKFSERLVCIDRQKGENFELVSLLILDDREECLPCAFLVANKVTLEVFKVFFTEIKNLVGKVETKLVLSEKFDGVSDIWEEVMETSVRNMICSWDILTDWAFNLGSVETQEVINEVYQELEHLLGEKDINSFTTKCEALLDRLMSEPQTKEFGAYFAENYASDPQTWACCYRYEEEDSRGFNQLKRIHSTLQFILNTKSTKKLNKALDVTLDFLRNKIYDRLILINNGKVSSKLAEIRNRHKMAEKMVYTIEYQNSYWCVITRRKEQNIVTLYKENCICQTKCFVCNVCVHTYVCSCIDSVLKLNMCRHIHSVCISEAEGTTLKNTEVVGGQRFRTTNLPLSFSQKAKGNQCSTQTSTKKSSKLNQQNNKKFTKEKPVYTTGLPKESRYSLESSVENRTSKNPERSEPAEQHWTSENKDIVQSDLLEVVGHEVSISNQEEIYENLHCGHEMDNEVEVIDDSYTYPNSPHKGNLSEFVKNQTIQSRKTNIELAFKTILNNVHSEEQLVKVENTVSTLQNDIKRSSSSSEAHLRKRKYFKDFNSVNKSPKVSKVFSADGKPLTLGKTIILKFAN